MPDSDDLQSLLDALDASLDATFETRLRDALAEKPRAWLVDELTRHVLRERHLADAPRSSLTHRHARAMEPLAERRQRLQRIERMRLDDDALQQTIDRFRSFDRAALESGGFLIAPPHQGKEALDGRHRSAAGEALLQEAHDVFYALLYGTPTQGVRLTRVRRDFLTATLPAAKAMLLERFMLAVTATPAAGTWLDPEGLSDDVEARNILLQVEFGDGRDEQISAALIAVLRLINYLEINEEILYARIEHLERSTLVM
ncbi:MAG: hypothetical protein AAF772_13985 [Acidobacteriota bacterium]